MRLLLGSMERLRRERKKPKDRGEGDEEKETVVDIRISVDESAPQIVFGDETRLRQIVLNIFSNALSATTKGYIAFSVTRVHVPELEQQEDQQKEKPGSLCELQFTCEDSGKGISRAECEDIFQPFRREHDFNAPMTSTISNVAGLGLPICRYLCKLMGGKIWVDIEKTDVGKGTTIHFTVNLRVGGDEALLSRGDVEDEEEKEKKVILESEDRKRRRNELKVLIAEDNKINQLIAEKLLRRVGVVHVEIVANGLEVVNAALRGKYDVILMDIFMPLLDGIEAAARIRAVIPKNRLVIIAWTASISDIYQHPETLFDHWLAKPTTVDSLTKILDTLLLNKSE